jgi:hypothetical protein
MSIFSSQCAADLDSVHFSLSHSRALDSRIHIEPPVAEERILSGLGRLPGPKNTPCSTVASTPRNC